MKEVGVGMRQRPSTTPLALPRAGHAHIRVLTKRRKHFFELGSFRVMITRCCHLIRDPNVLLNLSWLPKE